MIEWTHAGLSSHIIMALSVGSRVRFTRNSRHGDWEKGTTGHVSAVLAEKPNATNDIYLVVIPMRGEARFGEYAVWATDEDVQEYGQLSFVYAYDGDLGTGYTPLWCQPDMSGT